MPSLSLAHGQAELMVACHSPIRPADKSDVERWNHFVDEVDAYRACINALVETNHAASDAHRVFANEATEHWNRFVHENLNLPEDFPHESEQH